MTKHLYMQADYQTFNLIDMREKTSSWKEQMQTHRTHPYLVDVLNLPSVRQQNYKWEWQWQINSQQPVNLRCIYSIECKDHTQFPVLQPKEEISATRPVATTMSIHVPFPRLERSECWNHPWRIPRCPLWKHPWNLKELILGSRWSQGTMLSTRHFRKFDAKHRWVFHERCHNIII